VSSERIYLSPEEQLFLMEMFEISDPVTACEQFALLMVEEKADPIELSAYIKKVMKKWKKRGNNA